MPDPDFTPEDAAADHADALLDEEKDARVPCFKCRALTEPVDGGTDAEQLCWRCYAAKMDALHGRPPPCASCHVRTVRTVGAVFCAKCERDAVEAIRQAGRGR